MGKAKIRSPPTQAQQTGNGIAGSGIHGVFGSGVVCPSSDTSMYCQITKIFNLLIMLIFVAIICYVIYGLVSKKRGSQPTSFMFGGKMCKK